jgi:hypothetical protein
MLLLARARAELGVSLGYVLPEQRLVSAARWTGRALQLAEHLDDQNLLAFTLRVHGNELRKLERLAAAVHRLRRSAALAAGSDRVAAMVQLARATGELGDPSPFDQVIDDARRLADTDAGAGLTTPYALHEVQLRGLLRTGRIRPAIQLIGRGNTPTSPVPPQWQAIAHVTNGEILAAARDLPHAEAELTDAITIAEGHRLPHQIQRAARASTPLPHITTLARQALSRLWAAAANAPDD